MSERHELEFDKIARRAKDKQTIELYFMAVLPDGRALNVTQSFMPEVLEEIGQIPHQKSMKLDDRQYLARHQARAKRMANLANKIFNPMLMMLTEKLIAMHYGELDS